MAPGPGGFIGSPHCHVDLLLSSERARRDHFDQFAARGMELTGPDRTGDHLSPLRRPARSTPTTCGAPSSSPPGRRGEGLTARIPEIATGLRAGSSRPPHR